MKVLCVAASYYPAFQFGGPIFSTDALNRALVRNGVEVVVYTTNVGLERAVATHVPVDCGGASVTYFPYAKMFEFLGPTGWQFSLALTRALKDTINTFDLVYIVGIWNYPSFIAGRCALRAHKPYIVSARGALYPTVVKKKQWKKQCYYHWMMKSVLEHASAIHYATPDEARQCHPSFGLKNKQMVVPHGIQLEDFISADPGALRNRYPSLRQKRVVLYIGRVSWEKGFDILIPAFAQVRKKHTNAHLLIVGGDNDGYLAAVRALIGQHDLGADVTIAGVISGPPKWEVFAGSDIFVLPSYSDNFGVSVIEAFMNNIPVIISEKVGLADAVRQYNAGLVVEARVQAFADAMDRLLSDQSLCRVLAGNAHRVLQEQYNIDLIAHRMIREFNELIETHSQL